jgi:tetratricopeptide (TPR) repeat protein
LIGERVGRYEITGWLGDPSDRIYLADDPELGRRVAIELFDGALEPEAMALARLSHPHVVSIYDVGASGDGRTFVAMELVDGTPLPRYLAGRELDWRAIVGLFVQAGRGLAAAHDAGLAHGAFTADRALVSRDARVVVGDFGRARHGDGDGVAADAAGDQRALALALDEALAGAPASSRPRRLSAALARGRARDPADRFPSMDSLLRELEAAARGSRRPLIAAGIALAAMAAATIAVVSRSGPEPCPPADDLLAHAWSDEHRIAASESLDSAPRPYAPVLATRVIAALDDYGRRWVDLRRETCRATHVRREQSPVLLDARMACFDRRLDDFAALASLMTSADGELLDRGLEAVARLAAPESCVALEPSAEAPPPTPSTPETEEAAAIASRARALELAGRWDQAAELASRGRELARAAEASALIGELGTLLGILESKLDRYDEAAASLEEAAEAAAAAGDGRRVAEAWIGLTYVVGVKLARPEVALTWGEAAAREVDLLADSAALRSRLLATVGNVHAQRGDVPAARASYDEAVAVAETIAERSPIEHAAHLVGAGTFYRTIDLPERASELLEGAMAIYARALGDGHPAVAQARRELATVKYSSGDHAAARALHLEARAALVAALGPSHSQVAESELRLAETHLVLGEIAEAAARAQASIDIATASGDDRITARALAHLGEIRRRERRLEEALDLHRRALALLEKTYGRDHLIVGRQLTRLGIVYNRLGRLEEAEDAFSRSLASSEKAEGPESASAAIALFNLARVVVNRDRCDEATPMLERVAAIFGKLYGEDHADIAFPLLDLGRCALEQGRPDTAIAAFERALALRENAARDPMSLAEVHYRLAEALWASRRRREAIAAARRALDLLGQAEAVKPMRDEVRAWLRKHRI